MSKTLDEFYQMAMQEVPLKKMPEPIEVAGLVNFLLNQESNTEQAIDFNCGSVINS